MEFTFATQWINKPPIFLIFEKQFIADYSGRASKSSKFSFNFQIL